MFRRDRGSRDRAHGTFGSFGDPVCADFRHDGRGVSAHAERRLVVFVRLSADGRERVRLGVLHRAQQRTYFRTHFVFKDACLSDCSGNAFTAFMEA